VAARHNLGDFGTALGNSLVTLGLLANQRFHLILSLLFLTAAASAFGRF
jgi:hypothetical protein